MKVRVNEERALAVFKALENQYINKEKSGIFQTSTLPQDRFVPQVSEREYSNWHFFLSLFERGGIVSGDTMKFLWQLHQDLPELYDPQTVAVKWTPAKIEDAFMAVAPKILKNNGTGEIGAGSLSYKIDEHTASWHRNATMLHKHWGGDVRNVFWGVTEFEEAFRRVDYRQNRAGFKGMRRKIFSLLTIWLQEKNLIPLFPGPIPVDFHAMRVLWETDILRLNDLAKPFEPKEGKHTPHLKGKITVRVGEKFMDTIAIWSQKFLVKHNMSHLVINPALWLLSRDLCAEQFQNITYTENPNNTAPRHQTNSLPVHPRPVLPFYYDPVIGTNLSEATTVKSAGERMRHSRKAKLLMRFTEAESLRKNPDLWPANYKDPCSHCPIEQWCSWSIPAAPYYTWGILVRNGPRIPYHTQRIPGIVDSSSYKSRKRSRK